SSGTRSVQAAEPFQRLLELPDLLDDRPKLREPFVDAVPELSYEFRQRCSLRLAVDADATEGRPASRPSPAPHRLEARARDETTLRHSFEMATYEGELTAASRRARQCVAVAVAVAVARVTRRGSSTPFGPRR